MDEMSVPKIAREHYSRCSARCNALLSGAGNLVLPEHMTTGSTQPRETCRSARLAMAELICEAHPFTPTRRIKPTNPPSPNVLMYITPLPLYGARGGLVIRTRHRDLDSDVAGAIPVRQWCPVILCAHYAHAPLSCHSASSLAVSSLAVSSRHPTRYAMAALGICKLGRSKLWRCYNMPSSLLLKNKSFS